MDIALWDLAGKHFGVPCHRLAGRNYRRQAAAYATGFYRKQIAGGLTGQAPLLVEEAQRYVGAGFTALKVKIGFGIEDDVAVVAAVRDAVGPDVRLMVDANHAYDRAAAREVARRIDRYGIDWFEEPLIPEDQRGLGGFRRESPIPVATGEAEFAAGGSPTCCATRPPTSCSPTAAPPAGSRKCSRLPTWRTPRTCAASRTCGAPASPWRPRCRRWR